MNDADRALEDARRALDAGRFDHALERAGHVLARQPDSVDASGIAGAASCALGRRAIGLALLGSAVRRAPSKRRWLAALCQAQGVRFDQAKPLPEATGDGIRWPAWVDDALTDADRLAALNPFDTDSLLLAGRFHKAAGNDHRAAVLGDAALALEPDNVEALKLAGEARGNLGDSPGARRHYDRAAALAPRDPMVRWLLGLRRLAAGEFSAGWLGYEARFEAFPGGVAAFEFTLPRWQGTSLDGRRILVHGEQGLGDEIMFASVLPDLIERAEHVVIGASPSLSRLFARAFPRATVCSHDRSPQAVRGWNSQHPPAWSTAQAVDCHAPVASLARWLRTDAGCFPGTPYLVPDAEQARRFEARLARTEATSGRTLRVGINLATNRATGLAGLLKQVPREALAPLIERFAGEVHFVSLQARDAAPVDAEGTISDFAPELTDFDATAALAACLDVVVSTDSAVAHLAAALGKPTIVMLRYAADWRYGDEGNRCVWYHCMRLVRQRRPGDWSSVIDDVTRRLAEHLEHHPRTAQRPAAESPEDLSAAPRHMNGGSSTDDR